MNAPNIHRKRGPLSASIVLEAVARDLMQIKQEDRLTFAELGHVLGKSEDTAAKYCEGSAEIGLVAYTRAREAWNGRFTGTLDSLVNGATPQTCDRTKATHIAAALLELNRALEDNGEIDADEIKRARKTLEAAQDAINELLRRLTIRSAA